MIAHEKEISMTRLTKFLSLTILVLFILACTQPIQDVQNLAGTAESFATALPVETLKAVASQIPVSTLQALPSAIPDIKLFNPEGTPVSEWNGIPIMPQATAGEEFKDSSTYSFKVNATVKEAQDYYNTELTKLGWSSSFSMPGNDTVAVQVYQKDNDLLTVTITNMNDSVVVVLTLG
jgi:hypothetical protein